MIAMERTHRWRDDRAWMPARVRRMRWGVTGAAWATTGAAMIGFAAVVPVFVVTGWKVIVGVGAAVVGAGERAGAAMFKRELAKITNGRVELADLSARKNGELVLVRGKIACESPMPALLVNAECVYRRLIFKAGKKWVHEAAVDFSLVDEAGKIVRVQAAGARWLHAEREPVCYPERLFLSDKVPHSVQERVRGHEIIEAYEHVLTVGTEVQVVGYKTASADVGGEMVDYRLPPQRATLESGDDLPLVISIPDDKS
jgi:hypothetical protein